jgi:hypothetical protein
MQAVNTYLAGLLPHLLVKYQSPSGMTDSEVEEEWAEDHYQSSHEF